MFHFVDQLIDYEVHAKDGLVGKVSDFLFDDQSWTVRYVVVSCERAKPRRRVLVSPLAITGPGWSDRSLHVNLDKHQIESSPDIELDLPVSQQREREREFHDYYGWPYYWGLPSTWAAYPYMFGRISEMSHEPTGAGLGNKAEIKSDPEDSVQDGDHHLRSIQETLKYAISSLDDRFGQVEHFIFDDEDWHIPFVVADTINFWPSKSVVIGTEWIESVSWSYRSITFNLSSEVIKESPPFQREQLINGDFAEALDQHYRLHSLNSSPQGARPSAEQRSQRSI